jgi:hypothetical protein
MSLPCSFCANDSHKTICLYAVDLSRYDELDVCNDCNTEVNTVVVCKGDASCMICHRQGGVYLLPNIRHECAECTMDTFQNS